MTVRLVEFERQKTPEAVLEDLFRFLRVEVETFGVPRAVVVLVLDENNKISMKMNPLIPMTDDEWVGIIGRAFHLALMKSYTGCIEHLDPDPAA